MNLYPELADSRFDRNLGYRQPKYRLDAINEKTEKAKTKAAKDKSLADKNKKVAAQKVSRKIIKNAVATATSCSSRPKRSVKKK